MEKLCEPIENLFSLCDDNADEMITSNLNAMAGCKNNSKNRGKFGLGNNNLIDRK